MKLHQIFLNRWFALVWAAGIVWIALDVSSTPETSTDGNNQTVTDITGAPVDPEQVKQLEQTIANL